MDEKHEWLLEAISFTEEIEREHLISPLSASSSTDSKKGQERLTISDGLDDCQLQEFSKAPIQSINSQEGKDFRETVSFSSPS
jgi:hypothetical protein